MKRRSVEKSSTILKKIGVIDDPIGILWILNSLLGLEKVYRNTPNKVIEI